MAISDLPSEVLVDVSEVSHAVRQRHLDLMQPLGGCEPYPQRPSATTGDTDFKMLEFHRFNLLCGYPQSTQSTAQCQ